MSSSRMPRRVGLVTVLYNSAAVLDDFLDSIDSQDFRDFTLYFVDNDSTDDSVARIEGRKSEGFRVIANPVNVGVAAGNNQGIEAALADGCEWILLINNDTLFAPDFLSRLVSHAEEEGWQVATPLIAATDPADTVWYGGGHFRWAEGILVEHEHAGSPIAEQAPRAHATEYAPTCSLLVRHDVFARVGLMDASYFVYFDDVDFMLRLRRAGIAVVLDPSIVLTHKVSALTGGADSDFTRFWSSRNWILLQRKQIANPFYRLYCLLFVIAWQVGRILARRDTLHQARRRIDGFRAGLRADPADRAVPR